jgi:hypothetical protein
MAIIKKASNMYVEVQTNYKLKVGGKMEKIASRINVEATSGNLALISNKKIVTDGHKN